MTKPQPTFEEMRGAARRYFRTSVYCHRGVDGLGEVISGQLLNVSTTGALVLARDLFAIDEVFYLALVNSRRETLAERRCRVVRFTPEGEEACRIGVSFEVPLEDDILTRIT